MVRDIASLDWSSASRGKRNFVPLALLLTLLLQSCSLHRKDGEAQIQIAFQGRSHPTQSLLERLSNALGRSQTRSESEWLTLPESWSEFDCLGIQVSGDGVSVTNSAIPANNVCRGTTLSLSDHGMLGGLISTQTGGSIQLSVPIGADRTVQLFGLKTADGTCPSAESLFSSLESRTGGASHFNGAGAAARGDWPMVLASRTLDIVNDESISLTPDFLRSAPTPAFCDGTSAAIGFSITTSEVTLNGASVSDILADPDSYSGILDSSTLDFGFTTLLKIDRRTNTPLAASDITVVEDGLAAGTTYTTDSVTQVDDFSFLIASTAHIDLQNTENPQNSLRLRVSNSSLQDLYGRSIGDLELDVASAFNEYLIALGVDPEAGFVPGGSGGGSGGGGGGSSQVPQIGGFDLNGPLMVINANDPLYANGACGAGIDSLMVSMTDITNTKIIETLPCPLLAPAYSGYVEGHWFNIGSGLSDGPIDFFVEGLDANGMTVATDNYTMWLDTTPPPVSVSSSISGTVISLSLSFSDPDDVEALNIAFFDANNNLVRPPDNWDRAHFLTHLGAGGQVNLNVDLGTSSGSYQIDIYDYLGNNTSEGDSVGSSGGGGGSGGGGPAPIPTPSPAKVAIGEGFACFVQSDQMGVKCAGQDSNGQLGRGVAGVPVAYPTPVAQDFNPADPGAGELERKRVSGTEHTCSLVNDGVDDFVRCWGTNWLGQLGASPTQTGSPLEGIFSSEMTIDVDLSTTSILDLVAGDQFTCILSGTDSQVYCWGVNQYGQLGLGDLLEHSGPAPVIGLDSNPLTGVDRISAGNNHICASGLAIPGANGSPGHRVVCWGGNDHGKVGLDPTNHTESNLPVEITGFSTGSVPIELALGYSHSCALYIDQVYCWGANNSGQLGFDPYSSDHESTPQVVGLSTLASQIAANESSTCALLQGHTVECWGMNNRGQLGQGSTSDWQYSPASVVNNSATPILATSLSSGSNHTCAITYSTPQDVLCWGSSVRGQTGISSSFTESSPYARSPFDGYAPSLISINLFRDSTRVKIATGATLNWGANDLFGPIHGRVRDIEITDIATAAPVDGLPAGEAILQLAAGARFACALMSSGSVYCWGANAYGQLGTDSIGDTGTAAQVIGLGTGSAVWIAASANTACAVLTSGGVQCWGSDDYELLGNATPGSISSIPTEVRTDASTPLSGATQVALNGYGACALLASGSVYCWGFRTIDDGNTPPSWDFKTYAVEKISAGATALAMGGSVACIATPTHGSEVQCWGNNDFGNASPASNDPEVFLQTAVTGVVDTNLGEQLLQISVGAQHACALVYNPTDGGVIRCWGQYAQGQMGDGVTSHCDVGGSNCDDGSVIRNDPIQSPYWSASQGIVAGMYKTCSEVSVGDYECTGYQNLPMSVTVDP